jgi:excisionase family DNA binding protein
MKTQSELSPRRAAQRLGISLDSVYSLIWAGKLTAKKRDGRWSIPVSAVEGRIKARELRQGLHERIEAR